MTTPQAITEEQQVHPAWYEEAKTVTVGTLPEFVRKLTEDYTHDYGTICHAIAAAMTATMQAVNQSPAGGITGFQAGAVMWEVLQHAFHERGPMRLQRFDNLLYPQYEASFTTISAETWKYVREKAQDELSKPNDFMHPSVRAHLESIAEHGIVPFGLGVEA